ncbi:MAG: hypothetical protein VW496_03425 [Pelagibacteraceae bacterium]
MNCPHCNVYTGERGELGARVNDVKMCCYCAIKIYEEMHSRKQKPRHLKR